MYEVERKLIEQVKKDAATRLCDHTITAHHALDADTRRWRCQKPGTWVYGFDIITYPGGLMIRGDIGCYVFERARDMIGWFRNPAEAIYRNSGTENFVAYDYNYRAEKCVAHDGTCGVRRFDAELFEEVLRDYVKEAEADVLDGDGDAPSMAEIEVKAMLARNHFRDNYEDEHAACDALIESGLCESCDLPRMQAFTHQFIFCIHAIHWFIRKLDAREFVTQWPVAVPENAADAGDEE